MRLIWEFTLCSTRVFDRQRPHKILGDKSFPELLTPDLASLHMPGLSPKSRPSARRSVDENGRDRPAATGLGVKLYHQGSGFVLDIAYKLDYGCSRPPDEGRARGVGRGRWMRSLAVSGLARPKPQRSRDRRDRREPGSGRPRRPLLSLARTGSGPLVGPARGGATERLKPRGGGDGTDPFVALGRSARPGSLKEPCAGWLWPPARGGTPARVLRAPPGPRSQSRPALPSALAEQSQDQPAAACPCPGRERTGAVE